MPCSRCPDARWVALVLGWACVGAAGEVSPHVVLRWQPVAQAVSYEVQIARDPAFATIVVQDRTRTSGYRWQALPAEPHYWRVRSLDADGRRGDWSVAKTIDAVFVPPSLVAPADGQEVELEPRRSVVVRVQLPPVLARWQLEVAADAQFRRVLVREQVEGDAFELAPPRTGRLFWRALGLDEEGRTTAPSPARSLRVKAPEKKPASPAPPQVAVAPAAAPVVVADAPGVPAEPPPAPPPSAPPRTGIEAGFFVGFFWNLGALQVARGGLVLAGRPPWLGPVGLELRLGYYTSSRHVESTPPGLSVDARLHGFPLELAAFLPYRAAGLELIGGAGVSVTPVYVSLVSSAQPEMAQARVDVGGTAFVAVERGLGPGKGFVRASWALTTRSRGMVDTSAGGLAAEAGYRVTLW